MSRRLKTQLHCWLLVLCLLAQANISTTLHAATTHTGDHSSLAGLAPASPDLSRLPLSFEVNEGQAAASVRYLARSMGGTLFFAPAEVTLALPTHNVRLHFVNANLSATLTAADPLPGKVNYLRGNDPTQWRTGIATYASLNYQGLYRGIDLVYNGTTRHLKGTYTVQPDADPSQIRWRYAGAQGVQIEAQTGALLINLSTASGEIEATSLREDKPIAWQTINGQRQPVTVRYTVSKAGEVRFALGSYNTRLPLVIDPTLEYSTYLGGASSDNIKSVAVDSSGAISMLGNTASADFPIVAGAFDGQIAPPDLFVTKLDVTGATLLYSTFLGGSGSDTSGAIALDQQGAAYLTGITSSSDFPTTANAFDTIRNGNIDGFAAKLDATGSTLLYATYLGGNSLDFASDIAVDGAGSAYVAGATQSRTFPTTTNAFDTTFNERIDTFAVKVNPGGTALDYSTFLGGAKDDIAAGIALGQDGSVYVVGLTTGRFPTTPGAFDPTFNRGSDVFVAKLDGLGATLLYATLLGGNLDESGSDIAVDGNGAVYVAGATNSADFPTTPGAFDTSIASGRDIFVTKLNPTGSALIYSTYIGGGDEEGSNDLALDQDGAAYVCGGTLSADFPVTPDAFAPTRPGADDGFLLRLNATGATLDYSTYLGGSSSDYCNSIAVTSNAFVVAGYTDSANFPTTPTAYDQTYNGNGDSDAFIMRFTLNSPPPTITIRKDAQPDSRQNFRFTQDLGIFRLDDANPDDGDAYTNAQSFTVNPGSYTVRELVPSSWQLSNLTCTGGTTAVDLARQRVTITVAAGDSVDCTFVNTLQAGVNAAEVEAADDDAGYEELPAEEEVSQRIFLPLINR